MSSLNCQILTYYLSLRHPINKLMVSYFFFVWNVEATNYHLVISDFVYDVTNLREVLELKNVNLSEHYRLNNVIPEKSNK